MLIKVCAGLQLIPLILARQELISGADLWDSF